MAGAEFGGDPPWDPNLLDLDSTSASSDFHDIRFSLMCCDLIVSGAECILS